MTRPASPRIVPDSPLRRGVDVFVATVGLVVLAPVLAWLAVLVKITSRGPVLFRQQRVGRNGVEFPILKFRTMVNSPAAGPQVSGTTDPRVTRVGRWLRRTRLDELPQLVNLLRGDVTLIGPRPEVPKFVAAYTPDERCLLRVRPGIIGPGALLFAKHQAHELGTATDVEAHYVDHQMHPRLALDLEYLQTREFTRDMQLLVGAASVVIGHAD